MRLDTVHPPHAQPGTTVRIFGEGFGAKGTVTFGGIKAKVLVWTDTGIVTAVPATAKSGEIKIAPTDGSEGAVRFEII